MGGDLGDARGEDVDVGNELLQVVVCEGQEFLGVGQEILCVQEELVEGIAVGEELGQAGNEELNVLYDEGEMGNDERDVCHEFVQSLGLKDGVKVLLEKWPNDVESLLNQWPQLWHNHREIGRNLLEIGKESVTVLHQRQHGAHVHLARAVDARQEGEVRHDLLFVLERRLHEELDRWHLHQPLCCLLLFLLPLFPPLLLQEKDRVRRSRQAMAVTMAVATSAMCPRHQRSTRGPLSLALFLPRCLDGSVTRAPSAHDHRTLQRWLRLGTQ
mmetsp:Transcript_14903/g.58412  ORF Transcript_14903/g.58412 Transcript_14903/m.58412 type:complete len:271 (+) Transcript_14903:408-1220(+)